MGLFDILFNNTNNTKSIWDDDNEDWFEHSGEDHDIFDGHCVECEELEEDLED